MSEIRAFTQSIAKELEKSPATCYQKYVAKTWEEEPSEAMQFGTLVHCMASRPLDVADEVVVLPPGLDRRTKEGKAVESACKEQAGLLKERHGKDVLVVKDDLFQKAKACVESMHGNKWVSDVITACQTKAIVEKEINWDLNGLRCKGTPDAVFVDDGLIIDIKTTQDPSDEDFAKQIIRNRYHRQAGWYRYGVKDVYDARCEFVLIAVRSTRPFEVAVHAITDPLCDLGFLEMCSLMEMWQTCHETSNWKAKWETQLTYHDVPRWYQPFVFNRFDYEDAAV